MRSCAVLGVGTVCVLGAARWGREELRKAINVSQIDRKPHWDLSLVPVPDALSADEAMKELREVGITLVGLTAAGQEARPLWEVDLTVPRLALVFGRDEDDGEAFPNGAASQLDIAATIPMQAGTNDMLNLSNTVTAVAYERQRQVSLRAQPVTGLLG